MGGNRAAALQRKGYFPFHGRHKDTSYLHIYILEFALQNCDHASGQRSPCWANARCDDLCLNIWGLLGKQNQTQTQRGKKRHLFYDML